MLPWIRTRMVEYRDRNGETRQRQLWRHASAEEIKQAKAEGVPVHFLEGGNE